MHNNQSIQNTIDGLRLSGIELTTVRIIQLLTGTYSINHGIPPSHSANAIFGKYLKRNAQYFGITFSHERSINISGSPTTTAVWL